MLLKRTKTLRKVQKHNFTFNIYKKRIPVGILFLIITEPLRHIICLRGSVYISYNALILSIAATVFSYEPNAVRRKYPSPLGPNPDPGVPTTLAFSNK